MNNKALGIILFIVGSIFGALGILTLGLAIATMTRVGDKYGVPWVGIAFYLAVAAASFYFGRKNWKR